MTDYISRKATILLPYPPKEYREYQTMNLDDAFETGWDEALKCVAKIPAADVAPVVHGHFGKRTSPFNAPCSVCGASMNTYWKYCPMCGAVMDGGDTDDQS